MNAIATALILSVSISVGTAISQNEPGAPVNEPQYIGSFYALDANGKLLDLERTPVTFHAKTTAVQDRHKSDDPCCKRGLCVPGTGVLRLRSAAVS